MIYLALSSSNKVSKLEAKTVLIIKEGVLFDKLLNQKDEKHYRFFCILVADLLQNLLDSTLIRTYLRDYQAKTGFLHQIPNQGHFFVCSVNHSISQSLNYELIC